MTKLGFIGTGNMGGALAKAAAGKKGDTLIYLANRTTAKAEALKSEIVNLEMMKTKLNGTSPEENVIEGCQALMDRVLVCDNKRIAKEADYIFLGVKPQFMAEMLKGIADELASRKDKAPVLVSMAAGLSMDKICEMAGGTYPVIRIMPNTPVAVGEGMVLYCANYAVGGERIDNFLSLMEQAGRFGEVGEANIDAGTAVSGCGPAYVYMFAEALADGGVACGLTRQAAAEYAAQTIIGAAKLLQQSRENPGRLKDAVCSPGGSTIQGVRALEEGAFRGTVMDAVIAAYERTMELK